MSGERETPRKPWLLRALSAWLMLSCAIAPCFTLLAFRYSSFDRYDGLVQGVGLDAVWFAFPLFYVAALALAKGRMRLFVLLFALILVPYLHEWRQPVRGNPVPSPWYSTQRFDIVPDYN